MSGWQRAFVLHSRPYSETSLLLDFFTEGEGKIRLLAKGARRNRSPLRGCLQPFTPLLIRWGGKGEIKTLINADPVSLALPLSGTVLYSGLYLNELTARVLEFGTPYSALFFDYLSCLQVLAGSERTPESALRQFELALLSYLGYGVDFLHCAGSGEPVSDTMTYRYREEKGFIGSLVIDQFSFTGKQLKALASRDFPDADTLKAAKRFYSDGFKALSGR
ncbi:Recombination protein O [Providencia rustigianii]|nr:Recombination protein O [Providencia rustigianii]